MRGKLGGVLMTLTLMSGAAMAAIPHSAHAAFLNRGGGHTSHPTGAVPQGLTRGVMRRAGAAHRHALRVRAAKASTPASTRASARREMLALINAERARAGDGPLALDGGLTAVAQARSQDMVARHYFSHQIPGGGMVFDILDRDHVPYEMAGENIALNNYIDFYPLASTIQHTNTDLMNSPEHRANLLEPKYTRIGIGAAFEQGSGKLILTEVFVQP